MDLVAAFQRVEAARMIVEAHVLQFTAAAALSSRQMMEQRRADALSAMDAHLDATAEHRKALVEHIGKQFGR